jgi:hypothetical protein
MTGTVHGPVCFVDGPAPETFHAMLFKTEMRVCVTFQKTHQMNQKFTFFPGRIGGGQHLLQVVDVVDQRPVLQVKLAGTGRELFIP